MPGYSRLSLSSCGVNKGAEGLFNSHLQSNTVFSLCTVPGLWSSLILPRLWEVLVFKTLCPAHCSVHCTKHAFWHNKWWNHLLHHQQEENREEARMERWLFFISKPCSPGLVLSPKDVTQPSAFQEKRLYHLHLMVEASGPEKLTNQVTQARSQGVGVKGTWTHTLWLQGQCLSYDTFSLFLKKIFIWLCSVLVVAGRVFPGSCGISHFSAQAQELWRFSCPVACGILVPWPGTEPVSPALAGGVLTTRPPGKSWHLLL